MAQNIPDAKITVRLDAKGALQELEHVEKQLSRSDQRRAILKQLGSRTEAPVASEGGDLLDRMKEWYKPQEGGMAEVRQNYEQSKVGRALGMVRNLSIMGMARSAVISATLGTGALPFDLGVIGAQLGIPLASGIAKGMVGEATQGLDPTLKAGIMKELEGAIGKTTWATDIVNKLQALDQAIKPGLEATMDWAKAQLAAGGTVDSTTASMIAGSAMDAAYMEAMMEKKRREWTLNELGKSGAASVITEAITKGAKPRVP